MPLGWMGGWHTLMTQAASSSPPASAPAAAPVAPPVAAPALVPSEVVDSQPGGSECCPLTERKTAGFVQFLCMIHRKTPVSLCFCTVSHEMWLSEFKCGTGYVPPCAGMTEVAGDSSRAETKGGNRPAGMGPEMTREQTTSLLVGDIMKWW